MITTGASKVGFGKYSDSTIDEVATQDPCYLIWCLQNLKSLFQPHQVYLRSIYDTIKIGCEAKIPTHVKIAEKEKYLEYHIARGDTDMIEHYRKTISELKGETE